MRWTTVWKKSLSSAPNPVTVPLCPPVDLRLLDIIVLTGYRAVVSNVILAYVLRATRGAFFPLEFSVDNFEQAFTSWLGNLDWKVSRSHLLIIPVVRDEIEQEWNAFLSIDFSFFFFPVHTQERENQLEPSVSLDCRQTRGTPCVTPFFQLYFVHQTILLEMP